MTKEKVLRKLDQLTVKAGLNFNVGTFKKWIKQKLIDDGKVVKKEDKVNGGEKESPPLLSGAHIAISAMNEKLCYIILEKIVKRLKIDKTTGLYIIKFLDVSDIIQVDPELRRDLSVYMDTFDPTLSYKNQYCVEEQRVRKFIDDMFSKSIDINSDAFNLLIYLIHKVSVRVIDTAFIMMLYAKKKSLSPFAIQSGVAIHFSGTTVHLLKLRIEDAVRASGSDVEKEDDKEDDDEEEKEEEKQGEPVVLEEEFEDPELPIPKEEKKDDKTKPKKK